MNGFPACLLVPFLAAVAILPACRGGEPVPANRPAAQVQAPALEPTQSPAKETLMSDPTPEVPEVPPAADSAGAAKVVKTDREWREDLTREQYYVLRQQGTERPFANQYWNEHTPGVYHCAGCGAPLFDSNAKFESGTGWPSYWQPISPDAVTTHTDTSLGMRRVEAVCSQCGGHLGHVFEDGPRPTGLRYCMNSSALHLEPRTEEK